MQKKIPLPKELQAQVNRPQTSRLAYIYDLGVDKYDFNTLNRLSYNVSFMKESKFKNQLNKEILQRRLDIASQNFRKEGSSVIVNAKIEQPSQQNQLPSMTEVRIRMIKMGYSDDPKPKKSTYLRLLSKCKRNFTSFIKGFKQYVCRTKASNETCLEQQKEESEKLNKTPRD